MTQPTKPAPTHYLPAEGGCWQEWTSVFVDRPRAVHAIKFSDGSIFDVVQGWRNFNPHVLDQIEDAIRKVYLRTKSSGLTPYHLAQLADEIASIPRTQHHD